MCIQPLTGVVGATVRGIYRASNRSPPILGAVASRTRLVGTAGRRVLTTAIGPTHTRIAIVEEVPVPGFSLKGTVIKLITIRVFDGWCAKWNGEIRICAEIVAGSINGRVSTPIRFCVVVRGPGS